MVAPEIINIIDKGSHHLAVIKPANMVVIKGRGLPGPTLLELLRAQFGKSIAPVHRLDRGTYGICLFAKDLFGMQALSNAFRKHLIDKRYLAIVSGKISWDKRNIDARLLRVDDPKARKHMAHQTIDDKGQRALTRVKVISRSEDFTLVEASPDTGRMHQIRAHMAHMGHPIIGDKQYGSTVEYVPQAIGLFAFAISFPEPRGGRKFLQIELPLEAQRFMKQAHLSFPEKYSPWQEGQKPASRR